MISTWPGHQPKNFKTTKDFFVKGLPLRGPFLLLLQNQTQLCFANSFH
jgi:hypothetical protein